MFFQQKTLRCDQKFKTHIKNQKNKSTIHENTNFPRIPCGPVDPSGTVKLKLPLPYFATVQHPETLATPEDNRKMCE